MPRLTYIVLLVFAFACTVASRETSLQDSVAIDSIPVSDSISVTDEESTDPSVSEEGPQDTSRLVALYDEQLTLAMNDESKYYAVSITVSQYEGGADATWYFDKELSPRYFKETWSMEGQEGTTELIIENGNVVCAFHNDNHTEDKWCAQTGGLSSEWSEERIASLLPSEYSVSVKKEFEDNLSTLRSILKDGTITSESPDSYVVRIEQKVDVGQEVTEYTEVDIPKVVYDELMK